MSDEQPPVAPPSAPAAEGGGRRRELLREEPGSRPLLATSQLGVLGRYGTEHAVAAGEVLFADGDETYDLIVVLSGGVDIVEHHGRPHEVVLAEYGPREFLGEVGLLTGQHAYLTAVVSEAGRVLRIGRGQVREIMAQELDLSEVILRAFLARHAKLTFRGTGLTLVGSRTDGDTRRLLEVLARNRLSSHWLDPEHSPAAGELLAELDVAADELPLVVVPGGEPLLNPTSRELLDALGLVPPPAPASSEVCDLLVVGGGPAGLAAAVYGASEGMATTLAEDTAVGGQAGTSSRIENYLGFPAGLSGEELAARAALQAEKFGVRLKLAARATSLASSSSVHRVSFEDGEVVAARSVIIATGARYNRLPLERLADFEGAGVFYAATQMEALACAGGPIAVVGGGNSAGQAALYLARSCTKVHLVIRKDSLASSMSRYLIDQIEPHPRIEVLGRREVKRLVGDEELEAVELADRATGEASELAVCALFVFIGARPSTAWLDGQLAEDADGFLLTGADLPPSVGDRPEGPPLFLETSRPGIFCVGDVRSRSVKRVATAIGEGSMAVRLVFDRLGEAGAGAGPPRG